MRRTLSSIQYREFFSADTYRNDIYYGPVLLPDLEFIKWEYEIDDRGNKVRLIRRVDDIEKINHKIQWTWNKYKKDLLSGKGMEKYYFRFHVKCKRIVHKRVTDSILKYCIEKSDQAFCSIIKSGVVNDQIERLKENLLIYYTSHEGKGPIFLYMESKLDPAGVIECAIKQNSKKPAPSIGCDRIDLIVMYSIGLLYYQEKKKKKLTMN